MLRVVRKRSCTRRDETLRPLRQFIPLRANHFYLLPFVPLCLCVRFKDGWNSCSHRFLDHEVIHNELTAGGRVFAHVELQERLDYVAVVDRDVG